MISGQYLHLGCGDHHLPQPWANYDIEVDLRKQLPFGDGSARYIVAEHVIEHLTFAEGFRFLLECLRVLEKGGTLRLSFPDVTRFARRPEALRRYSELLGKSGALREILTGWGHQSCWTDDMAFQVLTAAGFLGLRRCAYNVSDNVTYTEGNTVTLDSIDGHHLVAGRELTELETTVIEAMK